MRKELIILFDLDDTLIIEEKSAYDALFAAAKLLHPQYNISLDDFVDTVKLSARKIWYTLPTYEYSKKIALSSWEALWARFKGSKPEIKAYSEIIEEYRFEAWNNALKKFGIESKNLPYQLSKQFIIERRKRNIYCQNAIQTLDILYPRFLLGLITNGLPSLQWEKIKNSHLKKYFKVISISGELDTRKPEKTIFLKTIEKFGAKPENFVMVGNSLNSDIQGAKNVNITAIWVNQTSKKNTSSIQPDYEINNLEELPLLVNKINQNVSS